MRLTDKNSDKLQETMWIEIIEGMEHLYAELADNQAELERKNRELSRTKEFIENVLNSMIDSVVVIDRSGIIKRVNRATLELLGYSEREIVGKKMKVLLGRRKSTLLFRNHFLKQLIEEGSIHNFEMDYRTRKGEKIPMSFNGSLMLSKEGEVEGIIVVARDMREIKNLQNQLVHSEKLASIGRLAAGIAHEINNPLTGILTFAHLLIKDVPPDDPIHKDLEIIVKEANRCKLITQGLLDFARQTEPRRVPVNINRLIKDTVALVKNQASFQNIKIIEDLNLVLPLVMVDPNQIKQVFMNIILNAQEAMPQGGFLSISSDFSEDGRSIEIKFTDTGCGIPEEHMGKIFDPFFTTKKTGKGTGLGLAISYGLIKRHRGNIEVESQERKGTTVIIKLPVKG